MAGDPENLSHQELDQIARNIRDQILAKEHTLRLTLSKFLHTPKYHAIALTCIGRTKEQKINNSDWQRVWEILSQRFPGVSRISGAGAKAVIMYDPVTAPKIKSTTKPEEAMQTSVTKYPSRLLDKKEFTDAVRTLRELVKETPNISAVEAYDYLEGALCVTFPKKLMARIVQQAGVSTVTVRSKRHYILADKQEMKAPEQGVIAMITGLVAEITGFKIKVTGPIEIKEQVEIRLPSGAKIETDEHGVKITSPGVKITIIGLLLAFVVISILI